MKIKNSFDIINCVASRTRSNILKRKNKLWVSATKTHNYLYNDQLSDWLQLYGRNQTILYKNNTKSYELNFKNFLMNKGIEFEKEIIKYYKQQFDCIKVADFYNVRDVKRTFQMMTKGIPIIYSAPIFNRTNNTYGIIDLLVRSDYINKMYNQPIISQSLEHYKAPYLPGNYHYRVIDIKYSTLNLCSDGKHLINSGRIPCYKSQLFIYNQAIGEYQGYIPNETYIMGRRWKYTSKGKQYSNESSNDRLGVIDFNGKDNTFIEKTYKAIDWYRNVHKNGINWTLYPPSIPELYPNMCIDSGSWNQMKQKISKNIGEITMIWKCGIKHRKNCHKLGILNWKDNRCNSKTLGFKQNTNTAKIVDNIINVNRLKSTKNNILYHNLKDWPKKSVNELYVDFETFTDVCENIDDIPNQKKFNIIFMIGVGYTDENNNWVYKSYICKNKTKNQEKIILKNFYQDYVKLRRPKVYYWSAEKHFWNKSSDYHTLNTNIKWIDMCELFKQHTIAIKGCFGFGLKNIVKSMREHNFINTKLDSECNNGMMAMIKAWNCYNNIDNPHNCAIMKDIEKYNEFDCKAIYDINYYIRSIDY